MARIPVITGFGGINAAGRSSGHHGYRRTVIDALDETRAAQTWRSLAGLMQLEGEVDPGYIRPKYPDPPHRGAVFRPGRRQLESPSRHQPGQRRHQFHHGAAQRAAGIARGLEHRRGRPPHGARRNR